jgi:o-succinylbenzoate synthase
MMRFWHHRYQLQPTANLSAVAGDKVREGALFKMQWPDQKIGYADFFPWPELGDAPIDIQLFELSKGHISPLLEQTVWLARRDANLRAQKKSAFSENKPIKNHLLINDFTLITYNHLKEAQETGFTTIKVKVGRDWQKETEWLNTLQGSEFKIRLDFNLKADLAVLERMAKLLAPEIKQRIEFIEDPFTWNLNGWTDASTIFPLALDQEYKKVKWTEITSASPFKVLVIKPARQDVEDAVHQAIAKNIKIVVTSSLDHPVGIAHAAHVAMELKAKHPQNVIECGCLSDRSYRPNDFSTKLVTQGADFIKVEGSGIGFDQLWESLKWQELKVK